MCEKCANVYMYANCFESVGTCKQPKLYNYKEYGREHPCNGVLLRQVELLSNRVVFYPLKVYCYMPLYNSLQTLLSRPRFNELCNQWKRDNRVEGVYRDVFDGKIWHDFQTFNGQPFLSQPYTFGLMLNIDWFKPCKHVEYSMGAMYLTIMNLPRRLRFRQENVILLLGLIPGPREPKRNINAFLQPFVHELLRFWQGVLMSVHSFQEKVLVRCALLCVACDIPASRKVCGFLGHSAGLGCSKCSKRFSGQVGQKDYSGFDRSQWPPRTLDEHKRNICMIRQCTTKTARNDLESKFGCRYSILLDLPYFNPIRMTVIDPMHNLYLGTAKRILKDVWVERGFICDRNASLIQYRVDSVQVPHYVGRIPHKIASAFSGFTADQFKNWTNLFSLMTLHDLLPTEDLQCWRYFVLASRILCQMVITDEEIKLADAFLLQFCCRVEKLYGNRIITPNMHLHCHLKQCLHDYGPIHNFWLFSYERYNGILEHFPSNKRSLEMQRFLQKCSLFTSFQFLPNEFESDFGHIFKSHFEPALQGSVKVTIHGDMITSVNPNDVQDWSISGITDISFPKSYSRSTLSESSLLELKCMYSLLYPSFRVTDMELNSTFHKYTSLTYHGLKFNTTRMPFAYAIRFPMPSCSTGMKTRPLRLHFFMLHAFHYEEDVYQHVIVSVSWLNSLHAVMLRDSSVTILNG